jgi:hypothetical protein
MPFGNHGNRAFTAISVEKNAPSASGVYGLSNAREWIYVGQCDNIKAQLLAHLHETNTFLAEQSPTGFTYELCAHGDRTARQNRLVLELKPVCNRRFGQRLSEPGSSVSEV